MLKGNHGDYVCTPWQSDNFWEASNIQLELFDVIVEDTQPLFTIRQVPFRVCFSKTSALLFD